MFLDGVTVADWTSGHAGPFAARILGDFGARVLRFEEPSQADALRSSQSASGRESAVHAYLNASKSRLALAPLSDPEAFVRHLSGCAILVESQDATEARALIADLRRRLPGLIVVSVSAYGRICPAAAWPWSDLTVQHFAGLAHNQARPVRRNVAFVAGGLVHQACDLVMKPVLSEAAGMDWNHAHYGMQGVPGYEPLSQDMVRKIQEVSAYFDAEVFREVYLDSPDSPLTELFMAPVSPVGARLEDLIKAMFQRALLASHTLKPDMDDPERWLDAIAAKVQPFYLDPARWVAAFHEQDPKKLEAYGIRARFYRRDDPTIAAAHSLRAGMPVPDTLRDEVIRKGAATSVFGEVLQKGLTYLRNGAAYWADETDTLEAGNYG